MPSSRSCSNASATPLKSWFEFSNSINRSNRHEPPKLRDQYFREVGAAEIKCNRQSEEGWNATFGNPTGRVRRAHRKRHILAPNQAAQKAAWIPFPRGPSPSPRL